MAIAVPRRRRLFGRGARQPGAAREALVGYAFVFVPMAVFLVFFIYPMGYAVYISRFDWGILGPLEKVGWDNYSKLWHDTLFRRAIKNTIEYTLWVVPAQMALGLLMAVVLNQRIRFRTFFRGAFYFPALASSAAIVAIAIYLLNIDGLVNHILGIHKAWFFDTKTALPAITVLNAWTTAGTMMLFYLASLQAIPTDVYEAAAIDGAGPWRQFWKITFPLLKPGHFFVAVVSIIGAMKVFDQMYIVSRGTGGPAYSTYTAVLYIYNTAIRDAQLGLAAAAGVVLFVVIFAFTIIQWAFFGRQEAG
ncbi:MAG: carbohydrate ABC transporter permease [Gaiellaceae bacterium]